MDACPNISNVTIKCLHVNPNFISKLKDFQLTSLNLNKINCPVFLPGNYFPAKISNLINCTDLYNHKLVNLQLSDVSIIHPEHFITLLQSPQIKNLKTLELNYLYWNNSISSLKEDQIKSESSTFFNEWKPKELLSLTSLKITDWNTALIDVLLNRVFSKSILLKELDLT